MLRDPRRRKFRSRRRLPSAFLPIVLAGVISVAFFRYLSLQMKPLIVTMATSKTVNLISMAVSEETDNSITEMQLTYRDFVDMEVNESGQVSSLSFRMSEGTSFKRAVIQQLAARLEGIDPDDLAIPIGNLTNVLWFSSMGPSVRIRVQSVGDVTAEYRNEFTSSGVNQTRHAVYLDISVTVYLLIPGETVQVSTTESVCVAETIIVGEVPDTYLNLQNGAN